MSYYYMQSVDPIELAARFSNEDVIDPIHGMDEDWVVPKLDRIHAVLNRLPDREADLVRLYFFKNKKQTDIAEIFGITQAAVSYRLNRAAARLRFLIEMPNIEKAEVNKMLEDAFPAHMDVRVFSEMYDSTCQSEVAGILEITQGMVRHRFIKGLRQLGLVFVDRMYSFVDTMEPDEYEGKEIRRILDGIRAREDTIEDADLEKELRTVVTIIENLLPGGEYDEDNPYIKFALLYKTFLRIRYNFNILREVRLPRWSNRPTNTIV